MSQATPVRVAAFVAALCLWHASMAAPPVAVPQGGDETCAAVSEAPAAVVPEAPTTQYGAVGGGTNGNLASVNALLSGVGLYVGIEWHSWTDTQRQQAINNAAAWGFSFLSPKIASEGGTTWYTSSAQLDQWITWCTQAGIKFFPYTYVNPSTGGTGTTIATNRAAAIAADVAQHCGLVLVDMEAEWRSSTDAYGPNMTAFGTAYRSACPDKPIVVTSFGDPQTVNGSAWPYAEMKTFADAYAPQWYYPWWSWYRGTKGVAGVKNVIDTCYNQCKTYFGSTYPMLPNAAWENDPSDAVTPAALPDLYAGTAYMRKFNAPIIWWEYQYMTRAIASALVGYGYFTDEPVPTGSPARPAAIVASVGSVRSGGKVTFTINIGGPAPVGGQSIGLTSSNAAALPVPSSVTVPRGASSVTFTVTAGAVSADTAVTLTATNSATGTAETTAKSITVQPSAVKLSGLSLTPPTIYAGQTCTGKATLSGPAPAGGVTIALSSSNPSVKVPSGGVTVAEGQTEATFNISASPAISTAIPSTITATLDAVSLQGVVTVQPLTLVSLVLDRTAVLGTQAATGCLTLVAPAPSGGLSVAVESDNTAAATVASPVTVPAGQTSVLFPIAAQAVRAGVTLHISASLNGTSDSKALTVQPRYDVNGDSAFTIDDALAALQAAAGLTSAADITLPCADADGNNTVDLTDVAAILKALYGS